MNLNNIMEIGILNNAKVENITKKTNEKRDLIIFKFTDNTTKYLDISAGKELEQNEKVILNNNTKLNIIYQNSSVKLEHFKSLHPTLDIEIKDGTLKATKK